MADMHGAPLARITYATLFDKWPDGDIWMDTPLNDIINSMVGAIRNADPRVKAVSIFANRSQPVIDKVNAAALEKGIHVVWINQGYIRLNPPIEKGNLK